MVSDTPNQGITVAKMGWMGQNVNRDKFISVGGWICKREVPEHLAGLWEDQAQARATAGKHQHHDTPIGAQRLGLVGILFTDSESAHPHSIAYVSPTLPGSGSWALGSMLKAAEVRGAGTMALRWLWGGAGAHGAARAGRGSMALCRQGSQAGPAIWGQRASAKGWGLCCWLPQDSH